MFTVGRRSTTGGVVGTHSIKRGMATAGSGLPSTIEPNQDRIEGVVDVGGSLSLVGRDMGATLGYDESARAGGAQAARERAPHQRDEAQRAALLEQAGEEKRTAAQQARLASIREQQASLAAQPLGRWLLTVPAEARVEPTEEATSSDTAVSASTTTSSDTAVSASTTTSSDTAVSAGTATGAEEATGAGAAAGAGEAASAEAAAGAEEATSSEAAAGAEGAASTNAAMDKPAKPPDRLNEQFAVTSAASVQELKEPEEPGEPAQLKNPEKPGEPAELKEPEKPGEPAELKEPVELKKQEEPEEDPGWDEWPPDGNNRLLPPHKEATSARHRESGGG